MDLDTIKKQLDAMKKSSRSKAKVKAIEQEVEKIEQAEADEKPVERDLKEIPPAEDRSAFNCTPCRGEGMTFPKHSPEGVICPVCHGTGKH